MARRAAIVTPRPEDLLGPVVRLARAAAVEILRCRATGIEVRIKADSSPLTEADEAAERIIVPALRALTPDIPVIAEEEVARAGTIPSAAARFWLVDPLDGTKEFVANRDYFTVNVALIEHARPILGVVAAPAMARIFSGIPGFGAWLSDDGAPEREIRCRPMPDDGAVVVASYSHDDPADVARLIRNVPVKDTHRLGSALKFGLLACGEADLYPRIGPTMEWDTAAGQAVLIAAGGSVTTHDGAELAYGKPGFLNPGFIARGAALPHAARR